MTNLLRLEDIDEFGLVRRIPRESITDAVLTGIRQLHEIHHIEPFLRSIIPDKTETPHGPQEIGDIVTTHLTTSQGKTLFAVFINKGRATQRVRSTDVSHQVSRVRREMPGVNLIALLAVGNIYDNSKADLIQAAIDSRADYMIVDAWDVARLFIAYQKACPKDGSPFKDGHCPQCGVSADEPVELTFNVHEALRYEFLNLNDVSHAGAKRYRANVLTDPHYKKPAVREIIKEATWALRQSEYYRSPITERHFGVQEADCVFLFVYVDLHDVLLTNWLCRTQWIRPDLPKKFRPSEWQGDEFLGNILINWNAHYQVRRGLVHRGTKRAWVQQVESVVPIMDALVMRARGLYQKLLAEEVGDAALAKSMEALQGEAERIVRASENKESPPVECGAANSAFRQLITTGNNVFVPFAPWSRSKKTWATTESHLRTYLEHYDEERQGLEYEIKKLR